MEYVHWPQQVQTREGKEKGGEGEEISNSKIIWKTLSNWKLSNTLKQSVGPNWSPKRNF